MDMAEIFGRVREAAERLHGGLTWWKGEILALLPATLRARLDPPSPRLIVDLTEMPPTILYSAGVETSELARAGDEAALMTLLAPYLRKAETICVRLNSATALKRRLSFPLAARYSLGEILALDLERQSPVDPDEITFDYRVVSQNPVADRVEVELRMVRKSTLKEAQATAGALGLSPIEVEFIDSAGQRDGWVFLIDRDAWRRRRFRAWITPSLLALVAVLLIQLASAGLVRKDAELDLALATEGRLRAEAGDIIKLETEAQRLEARQGFLEARKSALLFTVILAEVTRRLPDDSSVFELGYDGKAVRLRGVSRSASGLIAAIDGSPLFSGAEFRAPVTQGVHKGEERFDISFDVKVKGTTP